MDAIFAALYFSFGVVGQVCSYFYSVGVPRCSIVSGRVLTFGVDTHTPFIRGYGGFVFTLRGLVNGIGFNYIVTTLTMTSVFTICGGVGT